MEYRDNRVHRTAGTSRISDWRKYGDENNGLVDDIGPGGILRSAGNVFI